MAACSFEEGISVGACPSPGNPAARAWSRSPVVSAHIAIGRLAAVIVGLTQQGKSAVLTSRVQLFIAGSPLPALPDGGIALPRLTNADGPHVFGDGSHPTTRLCAGVVDLLCRQRQRQAVLDVGTGTGVLARIARARGASFVVGTDIDPDALVAAESHAALDEAIVPILFSNAAPDSWGARFDLVVANILEAPLHRLAPALARATRADGDLLLSGFTRPQSPALRVTFEHVGFALISASHLDDWELLRFRAT
jgi:SAM-dependent methyltransferase